jgi:hypothetical protein
MADIRKREAAEREWFELGRASLEAAERVDDQRDQAAG